jgi:hypothetical protein
MISIFYNRIAVVHWNSITRKNYACICYHYLCLYNIYRSTAFSGKLRAYLLIQTQKYARIAPLVNNK